jgi:hypothetical protein
VRAAVKTCHEAKQENRFITGITDAFRGGTKGGVEGGDSRGNSPATEAVIQTGNSGGVEPVIHPGVQTGVELHVVDGRMIAAPAGTLPPLSLKVHTLALLDWLRDCPQVPGVEVPVSILEHVLYTDFLRDTGQPMKSWGAVSAILTKLPGVRMYQADWRGPDGIGCTPVVVKIPGGQRERGKVVQLARRAAS